MAKGKMKKLAAILALFVVGALPAVAQNRDLDAHRLWFVAATSGNDTALRAYLHTAGIDNLQALDVLRKFRTQHRELKSLAQVNALVQSVTSELASWRLEQHIARESRNIHYGKKIEVTHVHHPRLVLAQFSCDMSGSVDSYNTGAADAAAALDGQPHPFYETVVTESQGNSSCFASHTLYATNNLNGPNTLQGSATASDYEYISNVQSKMLPGGCFTSPQSGCAPVDSTEGGEGICTDLGILFNMSWGIEFEWAVVFDEVSAHTPGSITWVVTEWCFPLYAPPDLNPSTIIFLQGNPPDNTTFIESTGLCASSPILGHGWKCTLFPAMSQAYTGSWDLQYCTKNPPPY